MQLCKKCSEGFRNLAFELFCSAGVWCHANAGKRPPAEQNDFLQVLGARFEPARSDGHWHLKPARLLIAPPEQSHIHGCSFQ